MEKYFSVSGNQIPIEYKSLYQEISKNFERKVADAIKFSKEDVNEEIETIFKKSSDSWGISQDS